jgi:hypothetical protein
LIFSDHYDENAASTIEATVSEVKLLFPGSDTGKLARDGSHFLCRWFWLTKEKVLLDLANALTLDGPTTERCILLLRILMRKHLGNKVPQHYRDPAGPVEVNYDTDAPASGSSVAKPGTMLKSGSRKLVKRGRDDESNDDNANGDDKDGGDDNDDDDDDHDEDADGGKRRSKKSTKPQPKRNNAKRMPTFQEASQLLLTRGELAVLSSTKSYSDVQGGLVLLKHKDASGTPLTTLLEIDKVPDVDAPYRPYLIQYVAVDGSAKSIDECVAGVELLLEEAAPSRRSLVNIRDRALEPHDYASWIASVHALSRYPATATDIKATIARIEALRKAHTKAKVKAVEQSNA